MSKILDSSRPKTSVTDFSLEEIIKRLRENISSHKIEAAFLFGSVVSKRALAWSDIDLIIVTKTELPFLERPPLFYDTFDLDIPIDILVYTPEEFDQLKNSDSGFWKSFRQNHCQIV